MVINIHSYHLYEHTRICICICIWVISIRDLFLFVKFVIFSNQINQLYIHLFYGILLGIHAWTSIYFVHMWHVLSKLNIQKQLEKINVKINDICTSL